MADDEVKLQNVFDPIQGDNPFTVEFVFNAAGLVSDVMTIRTDPLIDGGTFGMQINASTINLTNIGATDSKILNPASLGLDMSQPHIYTIHRYDSSTHPGPNDNVFLYMDHDYSASVATIRGGTFGDSNSTTRALLQFTNPDYSSLKRMRGKNQ